VGVNDAALEEWRRIAERFREGEGFEQQIENTGTGTVTVLYASGGSAEIASGGKLRVWVLPVVREDGTVVGRYFPRGWKPVGSS
jgi:hypothetical protein